MWLAAIWLVVLGWFGAAHAADPTGVLKLNASAPGAEVYLDGALLGPAPILKYVPTGSHRLRVVADNFDPFVRQIEVAQDKTLELTATLTPGAGTIEFTGPKGCALTVNGQTTGVPIRIPSPGPGKLAYHVSSPGFEDLDASLDVVKGRNYLVDVVLESSMGVVAVTTKPAGAEVFLDGESIGKSPAKAKDIEPGRHAVRVELSGYGTIYRQIDTTGGVRGAADITLNKGSATLIVNTGSAAAVVSLGGSEIGTGSSVKLANVGRGRAEVSVADGDHTASGRVDIPEGGTITVRVSGKDIVEQKALTSQWGFWAAIGGGAVGIGTAVGVIAAANQPEPAPEGAVVVVLP